MMSKHKEYLLANKYEKAIMIIEKISKQRQLTPKISQKYKSIEIIVPFENLLKDPKKYLKKSVKLLIQDR